MPQNCVDRNQKSHKGAEAGGLFGLSYLRQYKLIIIHIFWNKK